MYKRQTHADNSPTFAVNPKVSSKFLYIMKYFQSLIVVVALFSNYVVEGHGRKFKKDCKKGGKGKGMLSRNNMERQVYPGKSGCASCLNGGNFQQVAHNQELLSQQLSSLLQNSVSSLQQQQQGAAAFGSSIQDPSGPFTQSL
jgi:hypothetical protein